MTAPLLPGRLGTPDMTLGTDPRTDPRIVAALSPLEMDSYPADPPMDGSEPAEALHDYSVAAEEGFQLLGPAFTTGLPDITGVERRTEVITGLDGNDVTLFVHLPEGHDPSSPIPAVLHLHGGGMVLLRAEDVNYSRYRDQLAAAGLACVGVEFRNGGGKGGPHPFPAGLNDCLSGLRWLHEQRHALGVSAIVVHGESGGGNLTIATAMAAKRDGIVDHLDGVYAQCPYISGMYGSPPPDLPSLVENDGYFLSGPMMKPLVRLYTPTDEAMTDPFAWPYHATVEHLEGLPPHIVTVNELDPLRDEGLAHFRKLLAAGVEATCRTINGTCHAGDLLFPRDLPDTHAVTVRDVVAFARSVAPAG